ncbi:helix-turn-helix domain-containing protein [Mammaliicoccus sciuri]|uniref:helix-turn-helix domain-containing protein n=1 Tax=Mammaliicoccus sciuri TaxID=1296 RepID=UPI002DBCDF35|nr:helix-turn-helix transcriptional regulator [Mammaliicoccus sciuri]
MSVSYKPLWKQLVDKELKRTDLMKLAGLSTNIIAKLSKDQYISLRSIEKICMSLNCTPNDIFTFVEKSNK